jgi:hypothetical protein
METSKALTQIKRDAIDKFQDAVGRPRCLYLWTMINRLRAEVRAAEEAEAAAYAAYAEAVFDAEQVAQRLGLTQAHTDCASSAYRDRCLGVDTYDPYLGHEDMIKSAN